MIYLKPSTKMNEKPRKTDYVIPGLQSGQVGALISPGGSGKSMFALQLCCQIAGGRDMLGLGYIKTGKAVYLPAEDSEITIAHRLFAVGELSSPEERQAYDDRLFVAPLFAEEPDILNEKWYRIIKEAAEGARLVILDTLRMFNTGNENDSGEMARVIGRMKRICAETGAAMIYLHHTSKGATLAEYGNEQQASRGSSVLVDNVRWQGYLRNMTLKEAKQFGVKENMRSYYVQFGASKKNGGPPFKEKWYRKVSAKDKDIEEGFTLKPVTFTGVVTMGKKQKKSVNVDDEKNW